jgi:biopolymer transport protein ExbD
MGTAVGKRGIVSDPNVVPLIDILLVLLVIFMITTHSWGLRAQIPQECRSCPEPGVVKPSAVVIQVLADGSLSVNQEPVEWGNLEHRLEEVFKARADRTAFLWGDASVEIAAVARVLDVMHTAGVSPVGLLTQQLGNGF